MGGKSGGQTLASFSPERTRALGEMLGQLLEAGDMVALIGPLGTGKTVFAKGIAKGVGVVEEVTSPSFNIVIEYRGRVPLYHVDFYRLSIESEAIGVGIEDYLYGNGVTIMEWAERFPKLLPKRRLDVEINFGKDDKERLLTFNPVGVRMKKVAASLL